MYTTETGGRLCRIIINGTDLPTVYWGEMPDCRERAEKVLALCSEVRCNYVIYEVRDWNSEFSPWEFVLNRKMSFSGSARRTLEWLTDGCVPFCERKYGLAGERILCGYSLSGLFSLWAFYESQAFAGVISCSASLWFGGWISYAEGHTAPSGSSVYLSLGDREEKARDRIMATVGECTRRQYELVCSDRNVSRHILEWNEGGHFNEPDKRIAKGIRWMMNEDV